MTQAEWVAAEFERCWPFLEPALAYAGNTFDRAYVRKRVLEDHTAQLWPGHGAAIVTTIDTHPDGSKSVVGWLAGGDLEEVQRLEAEIRPWAKQQGCVRVRIFGRRGWLRGFKQYREAATILESELT